MINQSIKRITAFSRLDDVISERPLEFVLGELEAYLKTLPPGPWEMPYQTSSSHRRVCTYDNEYIEIQDIRIVSFLRFARFIVPLLTDACRLLIAKEKSPSAIEAAYSLGVAHGLKLAKEQDNFEF